MLESEAESEFDKDCLLEAYICVADGSQASKQRPVTCVREWGVQERENGG